MDKKVEFSSIKGEYDMTNFGLGLLLLLIIASFVGFLIYKIMKNS